MTSVIETQAGINTEAARASLRRFGDERLDLASLSEEIDEWRRHRAILLGDLAAGDFRDYDEATVRNGIAFADLRLMELARQATRVLRAPEFPASHPRGDLSERFRVAKDIDLVPLIEYLTDQWVPLRGQYHRAICPFHSDTDPSLIVYEPPRGWWCPVCNIGGDAVNFVSRLKSISAVEALELIEALTGTQPDRLEVAS